MDKIVKLNHRKQRSGAHGSKKADRPARSEAEDAVRTLIRWAGDDPHREGLEGTPGRVVRAFKEWYAGREG